MSLKHAFVSAIADGSDATIVQPQAHWNAEHAFTGGALGSLLYRDAGGTGGASWLDDVAAGSVLVSGGVAAAPAWSASPTVTTLTATTVNATTVNAGLSGANASVSVASGSFISIASRGFFNAVSDGIWTIQNAAGTAWTRLNFGGTTSSFPALTRNGAVLETKLADNSAYAQHAALLFQVTTAIVAAGAGAAPTFTTIGGSGPAVTAQNGWLKFTDSTGAACYVPVWK